MKDLLLPNTVNQKDEIPHTAGLNDTPIPHFKIQITEIPLEKKLNAVSPHFSLHAVEEVMEYLGLKHPLYLMFTILVLIITATNFHLSMLVLKDMYAYFEISNKFTDVKRDLLAKVSA